jgi:hypothetical protein
MGKIIRARRRRAHKSPNTRGNKKPKAKEEIQEENKGVS